MRPSALATGVYFGQPEATRTVGAWVFSRTSYAPGERVPAHTHEGAYLCLALRGAFRERSRAGELDVAAGAAVLHPPGETHSDRFGARASSCLNVALVGPWSTAAERWLARSGRAHRGAPALAAPLVRRIARELEARDDASALALEGLTLELLAELVRDAGRGERRAPPWLAATVERLRAEAPVALAELARDAGVHPATLARAFRRAHGCSPGEYRRRWRVERAVLALRASDLPLAELAARLGFADQSHLTRAVRRTLGVTPSALRRSSRERRRDA